MKKALIATAAVAMLALGPALAEEAKKADSAKPADTPAAQVAKPAEGAQAPVHKAAAHHGKAHHMKAHASKAQPATTSAPSAAPEAKPEKQVPPTGNVPK